MKQVYISGPLTGVAEVEKLKRFYERIGHIVTTLGFAVYVPHLHSDPLAHPKLRPSDVYALDRTNVLQSDLIIAYVGVPAIGVGQEVEIAHQNGIPVVLMFEKSCTITRMVRGNPSVVREIVASSRDQLLVKLELTLRNSRLAAAPAPNAVVVNIEAR